MKKHISLLMKKNLKSKALENVEQNGIVFLDEIDKVAKSGQTSGADVSREGVQRDLLPLVEGCTINTKYGIVKTDHILFIASGAFHVSKPSDLIPELQGRSTHHESNLKHFRSMIFVRILTEPDASLTEQYTALMDTEGVTLNFAKDGVHKIAQVAHNVNESSENIGARRLHTVMERLLENISYTAPDESGKSFTVDANYVDDNIGELVKDEDLSKYIL